MGMTVERRLQEAGYRLLGDEEDIERLIIELLRTKNVRYLKAIPFLLYKYDPYIERIFQKINKRNDDLEWLSIILDITARIFNELNIPKKISPWKRGVSSIEGKLVHEFDKLYSEFKDEFELQLRNNTSSNLLIEFQKFDEERNLQFALSQLFTKKEREMIKNLQSEIPVSKTDYEYFSRKTKKKLRSIVMLHDFSLSISSKTPKVRR